VKALERFRRETNTGVGVADCRGGVMVRARHGQCRPTTERRCFDKLPCGPKNNSLLIHSLFVICNLEHRFVTLSRCTSINILTCLANQLAYCKRPGIARCIRICAFPYRAVIKALDSIPPMLYLIAEGPHYQCPSLTNFQAICKHRGHTVVDVSYCFCPHSSYAPWFGMLDY
jgi:hypothetical protein